MKDNKESQHARIMARQMHENDVLSRVVHRDPCFRCGARTDLGCEHNPKVAA